MDLNHRPSDYETDALTIAPWWLMVYIFYIIVCVCLRVSPMRRLKPVRGRRRCGDRTLCVCEV